MHIGIIKKICKVSLSGNGIGTLNQISELLVNFEFRMKSNDKSLLIFVQIKNNIEYTYEKS